eukprot:SAG22_NODE_10407_length_537_cov_0.787671_1_plen_46_part_10
MQPPMHAHALHDGIASAALMISALHAMSAARAGLAPAAVAAARRRP